jgi:hypothetical protein
MAVRRSSPYNQLGIGDCGHVVHTWPQVHTRKGTIVICDECTAEKYGLPPNVQGLWVYLRSDDITEAKSRKSTKDAVPDSQEALW